MIQLEKDDWRYSHKSVELEFLKELSNNEHQRLILKGGTALMTCYGLDRFSEDLDFDALNAVSTINIVKRFCHKNGYEYAIKKDIDTVQRATIHYDGIKPLKIETSYRRANIDSREYTIKNNIHVYSIESLAQMKITAYLNRDALRDLFDATFIVNNYWDELSFSVQKLYENAFAEKGFDHFDLMVSQQYDDLINVDVLTQNFLSAYARLGLLNQQAPVQDKPAQDAPKQDKPTKRPSPAELGKRATERANAANALRDVPAQSVNKHVR